MFNEDIKTIGDIMHPLDKAINLACAAHYGRLDKSGYPEITHPLRVLFSLPQDSPIEVLIAAILHDVLEDTKWNEDAIFDDLYHTLGIDKTYRVIKLLRLLTHDKLALSYDQYIDLICTDIYAITIKLADIDDNLNRSHEGISDKDLTKMHIKHNAAKEKLIKARDSYGYT